MIELVHVQKTFGANTPNELKLYEDLNLQIEDGQFISVIGSNGSGKTTLFHLLAGTLAPDGGKILKDGVDLTKLPTHKRLRDVARVLQDPLKGVAGSLTIRENLAMAANKGRHYGFRKALRPGDQEAFRAILEPLELDLEGKMDVPTALLSGGQRQALALLMATMTPVPLLLLDEHTAALDPTTSERILALTEQVVRQKQITTLMITHNLSEALSMGDRLIMLHKGKVVLDLNQDEKAGMQVHDLVDRFRQLRLDEDLSDAMLLQ